MPTRDEAAFRSGRSGARDADAGDSQARLLPVTAGISVLRYVAPNALRWTIRRDTYQGSSKTDLLSPPGRQNDRRSAPPNKEVSCWGILIVSCHQTLSTSASPERRTTDSSAAQKSQPQAKREDRSAKPPVGVHRQRRTVAPPLQERGR